MPSRRVIVLCLLLAIVLGGWLWRSDRASRQLPAALVPPAITKQPVTVATRTFDPTAPPADMPPLTSGEQAECASDFQSNATLDGESQQIDSTHATLTVTQVKMTLQLNVTIWAPAGATQHVLEHEDGHRRISEFYYQTADQLAARIASAYMGKKVELTGADLNEESGKALRQMASEITDEYARELNPEASQQLYDSITDHSRNEVVVADAVAAAVRNISISSPAKSGN